MQQGCELGRFFIEFKFNFDFGLFYEFEFKFEFSIFIFSSSSPVKVYQVLSSLEKKSDYLEPVQMKINSSFLKLSSSSISSSLPGIFASSSSSSSSQLRFFSSSSSSSAKISSSFEFEFAALMYSNTGYLLPVTLEVLLSRGGAEICVTIRTSGGFAPHTPTLLSQHTSCVSCVLLQ